MSEGHVDVLQQVPSFLWVGLVGASQTLQRGAVGGRGLLVERVRTWSVIGHRHR